MLVSLGPDPGALVTLLLLFGPLNGLLGELPRSDRVD